MNSNQLIVLVNSRVDAIYSEVDYLEADDVSILWEGYKVGRNIGYRQMEKLSNLESISAHGFMVPCFPYKIKNGSAGFIRTVAIFD